MTAGLVDKFDIPTVPRNEKEAKQFVEILNNCFDENK